MRLTSAADSSLLPSLARVIYNGTTAAGLYIATRRQHPGTPYRVIYYQPLQDAIGYREGDRPSRSGRRKQVGEEESDAADGAVYQCFIQRAGVGHKNAQTRKELCKRLRCDDRMLRDGIEVLRADYAVLNRDDGKGYYLPEETDSGRADTKRWA